MSNFVVISLFMSLDCLLAFIIGLIIAGRINKKIELMNKEELKRYE